jgi:hypothetical protein
MEYLPSFVDLFSSVIELRLSYYQLAGRIPVSRNVHQVTRLAQSVSLSGRGGYSRPDNMVLLSDTPKHLWSPS